MKVLMSLALSISIFGCNNHSDEIDVEELKSLPSNFYAYRHGRIYLCDLEAKNFMIWFDLNLDGDVDKIFKIENLQNRIDSLSAIEEFKIDTINEKKNIQNFINLSRKYGFGHIHIDQANKIYFSRKDGLLEQHVMPLNDSVKRRYLRDKDFKIKNGWFINNK